MYWMGVQMPPWEWAILVERGAHCKVQGQCAGTCVKTATPIVMPYLLWNHELDGVHIVQIAHEYGQFGGENVAHCKV